MGSLMPGWDSSAPGVPPKDLQDYSDADNSERQGYFAKYSRMKSLRADSKTSVDQRYTERSIGRCSAPADLDTNIAFTSQRSQTLPMHRSSTPVDTMDSPRAGRTEVPGSPRSPRSPTSPVLARKSLGSAQGKADSLYAAPKWWKKFSSAHLNEMPEEDPNAWRTAGYTPQYAVAGQKMQYLAGATAAEDPTSQALPSAPPASGPSTTGNFISVH